MIVDCIADLHGYLPTLDGGDLLIIAGDLTASDKSHQYIEFYQWLQKQEYRKKIIVPGNHDNYFQKCNEFSPSPFGDELATYLCDSGTEFDGLKIWGTPWTKTFPGMNPHCKAFTFDTEDELMDKFQLIPHDTDILITHSPPYGILDKVIDGFSVGSPALYNWLKYVERPKLHVFGHIHEAYGQTEVFPTYNGKMMISVNASHVNERYKPINKPIRITIQVEKRVLQAEESKMDSQ